MRVQLLVLIVTSLIILSCNSNSFTAQDLTIARQEGRKQGNMEACDSAVRANIGRTKQIYYDLGYKHGRNGSPHLIKDADKEAYKDSWSIIIKILGNISLLLSIAYYIRKKLNAAAWDKEYIEKLFVSIVFGLLIGAIIKTFTLQDMADSQIVLTKYNHGKFFVIGSSVFLATFAISFVINILLNGSRTVEILTEFFTLIALVVIEVITGVFTVQDFLQRDYDYSIYHAVCISITLGMVFFYLVQYAINKGRR